MANSNLQSKAIKGLSWQAFGFTIQTIVSLLFLMIMGRYVSPDSFGSYGILNVFIVFILMLTEFGFGAALIQKEEYNQYHINATYLATITSAILAYLSIFFFSFYIAEFYDFKFNPIELQVLALLLLIKATGSVSRSLLVRSMKFRELTIVTILSSIIGNLLVGIPLAIFGYELWAIIIAILTVNVVLTLGFIFYRPIKFGFTFKSKEFKQIATFGGNLTLVRVFNQLGSQIDKLVLGKYYPVATIGYYERASTLSNMPKVYLGRTIDSVLFSAFSKVQGDIKKMEFNFFNILTIISLLLLSFTLTVIFFPQEVLTLILGPQWVSASFYLSAFGIAAYFTIFARFTDTLVRSKNRMFDSTKIKSFSVVLIIVSIVMGLPFGIKIVLALIVLSRVIMSILMLSLAIRILESSWKLFLTFMKSSFNLLLILSIKNIFLKAFLFPDYSLPIFFVSLVLDIVIYAITLLYFPKIYGSNLYKFLYDALNSLGKPKSVINFLQKRIIHYY